MVSLGSSSMQLSLPEGWLRNCQSFYALNAQLEQCSSARHSLSIAQKNLLEEHYQWDGNLTFQFNETVDYRLPLSRLTSLNIACTRHSQASLTLLSFARYSGIIQTSLASALAAPSVVGYHLRKQMAHVLAYLLEIEMLQAAISWWMKGNHYHHDFRLWHTAFTVIFALPFCLKPKSVIRKWQEAFSNEPIWDYYCCFVVIHGCWL